MLHSERFEDKYVFLPAGDPRLPRVNDTATHNHINPGRVARQRTCTVYAIAGDGTATVRWEDGYDEQVPVATLVRV